MRIWKSGGLWIAGLALLGSLTIAGWIANAAAASKRPADGADPAAGGLESLPIGGSLSGNLLLNPNFSDELKDWHASSPCFVVDKSTRTPKGNPSLKIDIGKDGKCGPYARLAANKYIAMPGIYAVEGVIKTKRLLAEKPPYGARLDLFQACATAQIAATADWTKVSCRDGVVSAAGGTQLRAEIYQMPTGTAWFGDLSLRREMPAPVRTFMLYPNYRGYLFPGQPEEVRFAVRIDLESGLSRDGAVFEIEADGAGKQFTRKYESPAGSFTAALDLSGAPDGAYTVRGKLLDKQGKLLFAQSPYRVVKTDSKPGAFLKAWIDDRNLAHFGDGKAHFVIGIYDTSGYSFAPGAYSKEVDEIAQAPINMLINYMITNAPPKAIDAYTDALQAHGIFLLPTVNNFYEANFKAKNFPVGLAQSLGASKPDDLIARYAAALAKNRAVVGYYVQDEAMPALVAPTFHQYRIIKANDPAGFDLIVLNQPETMGLWKDAVDVVGTDPYPIVWASNNDLAEVGDWTRQVSQAVHGARPVWTVIQFLKMTSQAAWPTEQQLHDMTWMAIAEGAAGVFYWSHGARGLAWVKDPIKKAALWREVIDVTKEVKEMEPVLLRPDSHVLAGKPVSDIVTREMAAADGTRYLIAYNRINDTTHARFTMLSAARSVKIMRGGAKIALETPTTFEDTFAAYEAKVYEIR
ncbi:MAG: hypothetical protein ACREQI_07310 [Candidatus Binataceae bacterium]